MDKDYEFSVDGFVVDNMSQAHFIMLSKPTGERFLVTKKCNSNHRSTPNEILMTRYRNVRFIKACKYCTCFRKTQVRAVKEIEDYPQPKERIEWIDGAACSNPMCQQYQQYRNEFQNKLGVLKDGSGIKCRRTALFDIRGDRDNICGEMHGGLSLDKPKVLPFDKWVTLTRESKYPILAKLRFVEDESGWIVHDIKYKDDPQYYLGLVLSRHDWDRFVKEELNDDEKAVIQDVEKRT